MTIGPGRAGGWLSMAFLWPVDATLFTAPIAKTSLAHLDAARRRDRNARCRLSAGERAGRGAVAGVDAAQLAVLAVLLAAAEGAGIEELSLHLGEAGADRDAVRRAGVAGREGRRHGEQGERAGGQGANKLGRHRMTPRLCALRSSQTSRSRCGFCPPSIEAASRRHSEPVHTSGEFVVPQAAGPLP